jgi:hypothetical protein
MLPAPSSTLFPLLTLAAITAFMAFIGLRVHYVWIDEVAYAEAAINYVKDGSYTSAAFFTSRADETHVSPTPAHSFLLIGWLKIFGVSQTSVRTLTTSSSCLSVFLSRRSRSPRRTRRRISCLLIRSRQSSPAASPHA